MSHPQLEDALVWARITANRYTRSLPVARVDREQFAVEAELAAWRATETYDPRRGAAFRTHVLSRIRFRLTEEARQQSHLKWRPHLRLLGQWNRGEIDDIDPRLLAPDELDAFLHGDDGTEGRREELLADDAAPSAYDELLEHEEAGRVAQALRLLPGRLRRLIVRRYWEGATFRAIAAQFGVSETRSHQLHDEALARLRTLLREEEEANG